MKRFLLPPGFLLAFLAATAILVAAQESPAPQHPLGPPAAAPDERQMHYVTAYRDVHASLKREYDRLLTNLKEQTLEWKRQRVEMQSRARHSGGYRRATMRLKAEEEDIQSRIRGLYGQRAAIRADAAEHYKGQVPRDVADRWSEVEKDHAAFLQEISKQVKQDMAQRKPLKGR